MYHGLDHKSSTNVNQEHPDENKALAEALHPDIDLAEQQRVYTRLQAEHESKLLNQNIHDIALMEAKHRDEENNIIRQVQAISDSKQYARSRRTLRILHLDSDAPSGVWKSSLENSMRAHNFTLKKTHNNLQAHYGHLIATEPQKLATLQEMILNNLAAVDKKVKTDTGQHGPLAETLRRCLLDHRRQICEGSDFFCIEPGLLEPLINFLLGNIPEQELTDKLYLAWQNTNDVCSIEEYLSSVNGGDLVRRKKESVYYAIPKFLTHLARTLDILQNRKQLNAILELFLKHRDYEKAFATTLRDLSRHSDHLKIKQQRLESEISRVKSQLLLWTHPLRNLLENISYCFGGNEAISLRGVLWYNHLNYNLTADHSHASMMMYLWYHAAKDPTIKTSTSENREAAHRLALEHGVRAHNRNNDGGYDDWRRCDLPACTTGINEKLPECFTKMLCAHHPDNVFVPELNVLVNELFTKMIKPFFMAFNFEHQCEVAVAMGVIANIPTKPDEPNKPNENERMVYEHKLKTWEKEIIDYKTANEEKFNIFYKFKQAFEKVLWDEIKNKFGYSDSKDKDSEQLKQYVDMALTGLQWIDFNTYMNDPQNEQKKLAEQKQAAEQQRLAEARAAQEREAEQKKLAELRAAQERAAEQQRLAEARAAQEREAEQKKLAELRAAQERAVIQHRLAEARAAHERKASEQKRLAELRAAQERAAEIEFNKLLTDLYDAIETCNFEAVCGCFEENSKQYSAQTIANTPFADSKKRAALHVAYLKFAQAINEKAKNNCQDIIDFLDANGADINQKDAHGMTPSDIYEHWKKNQWDTKHDESDSWVPMTATSIVRGVPDDESDRWSMAAVPTNLQDDESDKWSTAATVNIYEPQNSPPRPRIMDDFSSLHKTVKSRHRNFQ